MAKTGKAAQITSRTTHQTVENNTKGVPSEAHFRSLSALIRSGIPYFEVRSEFLKLKQSFARKKDRDYRCRDRVTSPSLWLLFLPRNEMIKFVLGTRQPGTAAGAAPPGRPSHAVARRSTCTLHTCNLSIGSIACVLETSKLQVQ